MRILILGGTVFLGRAATDAALAKGHEVTHFHRGRSSPADPRVETLIGDRTANLDALADGRWDAAIDTSGYLPQVVRHSAQRLRERVARYLFVSSVSVYASFARRGVSEEDGVAAPVDPVPDAMAWDQYGALKAMCEAVVREAYGDRALIVRPGLLVGPHDPTDRFTYWPHRVAAGGRVAAPVRPSLGVQFIDVRDLAEWMVAMLGEGACGTFNATGAAGTVTMGDVLETSRHASGSDAKIEWMDEAFLAEHGARHWTKIPLQVPEADAEMRGFAAVSIERALARGLRFRPLAQTVADTLAWSRTRPADHEWKAGLSSDEERALLARWDAKQTQTRTL